jgi:hypothetical protein
MNGVSCESSISSLPSEQRTRTSTYSSPSMISWMLIPTCGPHSKSSCPDCTGTGAHCLCDAAPGLRGVAQPTSLVRLLRNGHQLGQRDFLCPSWRPTDTFSPAQPRAPQPNRLGPDIPFASALPTAVRIPTTVTSRVDSFINEMMLIFLGTTANLLRLPHVVPLVVHVSNRPHGGTDEPLPRSENLSEPKLEAEGTPAEEQIVLGWCLKTRRLIIKLPSNKFIAWTVDVAEILRTGSANFGALESCVGQLNHAAFVIPMSRHFLNRLRDRLKPRQRKNQRLTLSPLELDDLQLWLNS